MIRYATVLIAITLVIMFWPGHSFAAQRDEGVDPVGSAPTGPTLASIAAEDSTEVEQTGDESGGEQLSDQWSREMGVLVMTRAELDTLKIVKGWFAHVVYASEGVRGTVNGEIVGKDTDGIVVKSGPWERREIVYAVIETLAVAPDRRTLEKWRRAREAADYVTVMYRDDLDPSQIETGWYAHVVYTTDGKESAATGEIVATDSSGVTIEHAPPVRRRGFARRRRVQIAFEEIDVIVVAEGRDAVEAWPKTSLAAGLETPKKPKYEIGANLLSALILFYQSGNNTSVVNGGGGLSRLSPSFYISSFLLPKFTFDVGMGFTYRSASGGSSRTTRVLQGGFTFLSGRPASSSPYGRIFAVTFGGDYSNSRFGAGFGAGTRHVFRNGIALRYEMQYVRWFDNKVNQIEFLLNVGVVLGGR